MSLPPGVRRVGAGEPKPVFVRRTFGGEMLPNTRPALIPSARTSRPLAADHGTSSEIGSGMRHTPRKEPTRRVHPCFPAKCYRDSISKALLLSNRHIDILVDERRGIIVARNTIAATPAARLYSS